MLKKFWGNQRKSMRCIKCILNVQQLPVLSWAEVDRSMEQKEVLKTNPNTFKTLQLIEVVFPNNGEWTSHSRVVLGDLWRKTIPLSIVV